MTDNIRRLFHQMDEKTKADALVLLIHELHLQSKASVLKDWIIEGRIPDIYQERTVQLFQNQLRKQLVKPW